MDMFFAMRVFQKLKLSEIKLRRKLKEDNGQ